MTSSNNFFQVKELTHVEGIINQLKTLKLKQLDNKIAGAIARHQQKCLHWLDLAVYAHVIDLVEAFSHQLEKRAKPSWINLETVIGTSFDYDWQNKVFILREDSLLLEEISSPKIIEAKADKAFYDNRLFFALQTLTCGSAYYRNINQEYSPLGFDPLIKQNLAYFPENIRQRLVEQLIEPVNIFPTLVVPDVEGTGYTEVAGRYFNTVINNEVVQGYLTVKLYPLVIDESIKEAYYPFELDITWAEQKLENNVYSSPSLIGLTSEQRQYLWQHITRQLQNDLHRIFTDQQKDQYKSNDTYKIKSTIINTLKVPQQTSEEIKTLSLSLTNNILGNWKVNTKTHTLDYQTSRPLKVQLPVAFFNQYINESEIAKVIFEELRGYETEIVLLTQMLISTGLQHREVTIEVDQLIDWLKWDIRTAQERKEKRIKISTWINLLSSLQISGKRLGAYKDKHTKQTMDLSINESFIRILTTYTTEDPADKTPLLIAFSYDLGSFFNKHRVDKSVLPQVGNLAELVDISSTGASAWAKSIGLALNQLWRERATKVEFLKIETNNSISIKYPYFNRHELLTLFGHSPDVQELLTSTNANRAKKYWDKSIIKLQQKNFIGYYKEVQPSPNLKASKKEIWLYHQQLDIRPCESIAKEVEEINAKLKKTKKIVPK